MQKRLTAATAEVMIRLNAYSLNLMENGMAMKISVFFESYCPYHESKDPGQIPLGLMENGVDTSVITLPKNELGSYHPRFPLVQRERREFDTDYWLKDNSDAIISYSAAGKTLAPLIEKMQASGKKVLCKLDCDGRVAYPLKRHHHRVPLRERFTVIDLISEMYWRFPSKTLKRKKHAKIASIITHEVELSNGTIIESPEALANFNYFLTFWGRSDLIKKMHFIPNPVTPEFLEGPVKMKENVAVAHGRWDDYTVKNTPLMVATVVEFLTRRPDWRFVIFGSGTDQIKTMLESAPATVKARIDVLGLLDHDKVRSKIENAKLFFIPSRWESFSIAAAEALCTGCSIVVTPAEALRYLSMQGFSGSTAATFDKDAILAALLMDATKWDRAEYDPVKIAEFWRPRLDRRNIAKQIQMLAETC
jgi:glycosyltransferase involved in cell wall biosynthesis